MKDRVVIYVGNYCGYCESAKRFLKQKNIPFTTVDLSDDDELREKLSKEHNWRTIPMIFIDDRFIGGYTEMLQSYDKGDLDTLHATK